MNEPNTELDKAIESAEQWTLISCIPTRQVRDVHQLLLAAKRLKEVEKERDEYIRDSMIQIGVGNQRTLRIDQLREALKECGEALNSICLNYNAVDCQRKASRALSHPLVQAALKP